MQRIIEVSDFEMKRARDLMENDGWNNPSDNAVFDMAVDIRERMEDCSMSAYQAYMDIMY